MDERKTREHRRKEVCRRFRASGLTRKAFCEKNSIALSTLDYWLQKERGKSRSSNSSEMVRIGTSDLSRRVRIRVKHDIVIELDLPVSEQEMRTILRSVVGL